MKLVQLLAKELKKWPEGVSCMVQDCDGRICTCLNGFPDPYYGDWTICGPTSMDSPVEWADTGSNKQDLAHDQASAIITIEAWQAEREKMNKPKWIRHRGGKQPVADSVKVEYRMRDGDISTRSAHAAVLRWAHLSRESDIMAYRVIEETKDQEIEEVENIDTGKAPTIEYAFGDKDSDPKDLDWKQLGTITCKLEIDAKDAVKEIDSLVAKLGQIESPLKWRDAIIHCQAIIEDCEREIQRNVNLLDAEGLMMQKDSKKAMQYYQTDIDMSDWRNWQIGDLVCATKNFDDADIGDELIITRLDHADEEQPIGMSTGSSATYWPEMNWVKFVRRP